MRPMLLLFLVLAGCDQPADSAQACLDAQAVRAGAAHRLGCPTVKLDCPTGPIYVSDSVECVAVMAEATSCDELAAASPCDGYLRVAP